MTAAPGVVIFTADGGGPQGPTGPAGAPGTPDYTVVILRNGNQPWQADQSVGGFRLTSLGAPSVGSDAANKTYVDSRSIVYFTSSCYVDGLGGNDSTAVRGSVTKKFQTIQGAINAAASGDVIRIACGDYTENPVAKTNVTLVGEDRRNVRIVGNITWAPVDSVDEITSIQHLTVTGDVGMDATGKSGGLAYFYCVDSSAATATTVGRPGLNTDGLWLEAIALPESTGSEWTTVVTDGVLITDNVQLGLVEAHGDALISLKRSIVFGTLTHDGAGTVGLVESECVGNVLLSSPVSTGAFREARDCIFYGDVSVGNTFTWNAYDCSFLGTVGAHGSGVVNRNDGPFVGASDVDDGREGLVPQPFAGQSGYFLRGNGSWTDLGLPINANTSSADATPAQLWSFTLNADTTYVVEASVVCVSSNSTHRGTFKRRALVSRTSSAAAVLNGASQIVGTDAETDVGLDAAFTVSGNDVRLMVTGLAATNIAWNGKILKPQDVSPGPS